MKESIGYTFVDIVQLAKTNSIPVTEEGLHLIIDCWQNYEQLNDDMLLFTREYCKTINLPFRISYFTLFIRNLLR